MWRVSKKEFRGFLVLSMMMMVLMMEDFEEDDDGDDSLKPDFI